MADDEQRPGLAGAAGKAAFYPARAAARAWRGPLEDAVDEVLSAPEVARVLDRALAGDLPEEFARSLIRHRVLERIVAELSASGELDRLVSAALASDETKRALTHVAASPELREAVARQTTGLADDVVSGLRTTGARLDDRIERVVRRRPRPVPPVHAGVVTRAAALAIDVALMLVAWTSIVGVAALVSSLVGTLRPAWLAGALLAAGWIVVAAGYFVLFWSSAGQTPGMRVLRLRVRRPDGRAPGVGRSIVRVVGLVLAIVPLFAGFLPVLFTERRRGLPDFLAGTVVVYDDPVGRGREGGP
jgi:uncharacterized RDD family membrane protein YckC